MGKSCVFCIYFSSLQNTSAETVTENTLANLNYCMVASRSFVPNNKHLIVQHLHNMFFVGELGQAVNIHELYTDKTYLTTKTYIKMK
jgi:hypothetical protein